MRLRRFVVGAATLAVTACGAITAPIDSFETLDASTGPDGSPFDASPDRPPRDAPVEQDAGADAGPADVLAPDVDAGPPCDPNAPLDAALCTPPADDLFVPSPASIQVSADTYGIASFVASGPWASDPKLYFDFDGADFALQTTPYIMTNRPPVSWAFLVDHSATQGTATFSASAHLGNIVRSASVTVTVGGCVPWTVANACDGNQCGFASDNCGGSVSCGMCPPDAPSCSLGKCTSGTPVYCPSGQGIGIDGMCTPCSTLPVCTSCNVGNLCVGLQDVCLCVPVPFPPCPSEAPFTGDQCPTPAETCNYHGGACGLTSCQCEPSYTWDCTEACDAGTSE